MREKPSQKGKADLKSCSAKKADLIGYIWYLSFSIASKKFNISRFGLPRSKNIQREYPIQIFMTTASFLNY